jgi:hypothetical protein
MYLLSLGQQNVLVRAIAADLEIAAHNYSRNGGYKFRSTLSSLVSEWSNATQLEKFLDSRVEENFPQSELRRL